MRHDAIVDLDHPRSASRAQCTAVGCRLSVVVLVRKILRRQNGLGGGTCTLVLYNFEYVLYSIVLGAVVWWYGRNYGKEATAARRALSAKKPSRVRRRAQGGRSGSGHWPSADSARALMGGGSGVDRWKAAGRIGFGSHN